MDLSTCGVVVYHGFTSTPASVLPLADALRTAGCTVAVPSLPGHGTAWQDLERRSAAEILRAGLAAYDALATTCTHVMTAGLSMGGAIALHVAARRRTAGVIPINPALRLKPFTGVGAALLGRAVRTIPPIAGDIARDGVVEEAYERTPLRGVVQLSAMGRQVRRELPGVRERGTPVLLMRSAQDNILPQASADTLVSALDPSQLTVLTLQNSLHVATLDHDADLIGRESVAFLARQLAADLW